MRAAANVDKDQTAIFQFCLHYDSSPHHYNAWPMTVADGSACKSYTLKGARWVAQTATSASKLSFLLPACFKAAAIHVIFTQHEPIADV